MNEANKAVAAAELIGKALNAMEVDFRDGLTGMMVCLAIHFQHHGQEKDALHELADLSWDIAKHVKVDESKDMKQ